MELLVRYLDRSNSVRYNRFCVFKRLQRLREVTFSSRLACLAARLRITANLREENAEMREKRFGIVKNGVEVNFEPVNAAWFSKHEVFPAVTTESSYPVCKLGTVT